MYSYKAQPSRVLWDLNKLVKCIAPLVGFEALKGSEALVAGFADNATKEDVEEWTDKGLEVMEGFEEEYYKIERNAEQEGWMKVSHSHNFSAGPIYIYISFSRPRPEPSKFHLLQSYPYTTSHVSRLSVCCWFGCWTVNTGTANKDADQL